MMNRIALAVLACLTASVAARAQDTNFLSDPRGRSSYAAGLNLENNWKRNGLDFDFDLLLRGLKDAKAGGPALLTEDQVRETLSKLQQEVAARQQEQQQKLAETNKVKAAEFLARNKKEPGIITLPDGLQYKVLAEGTGRTPASNDLVTVNYRATLLDGTEVDNSYKRNQPWTAPLNRGLPFPGAGEVLGNMKLGAKWQLFIPPDRAYGDRILPNIPPNSLLIVEVEMLTNAPAPPPAPATPLTSDIIRVPSAEEMKQGAKIETIKAEDVDRYLKQQASNSPPASAGKK